MTTARDWLTAGTEQLKAANIETARLDCLVLLEDETNHDRSWLLAHPEYNIPDLQLEKLGWKLERRTRHEPLAYIRGVGEFYGRSFAVDEHVLVPRPESEIIIELLLKLPLTDNKTIIDIGTGSGALAVTAALERSEARVIATDIDRHCLAIARKNAVALGAAIEFFEADLLHGDFNEPASMLLCNLPYVPDAYAINRAATHEPGLALFGGPDGLDVFRRLFGQLQELPATTRPMHILTESLPSQHDTLHSIASLTGYTELTRSDFIQVFGSV